VAQVDNIELPKLFEVWNNPSWVGEEADKYRNVVKDYGETYDDSLDSLWQIEYRKESDIPEIINKFDRCELVEYCDSKIKYFNDRYGDCFGEEWLNEHISLYVKIKEWL